MAEEAKQFAIIEKIKSLVKKTGRSLWFGQSSSPISEEVAKKIQRNSFDLSKKHEKDVFTPPYVAVAEQMHAEQEQIFRAAVFNLANVAANTSQYKQNILKIFDQYLHEANAQPERKDYVKAKSDMLRSGSVSDL